jgi:hypothetical protein
MAPLRKGPPPAAAAVKVSPVLKDTVHYSASVVVVDFPVVVASKITEQSAAYATIAIIVPSPTVPLAYIVSPPLPLLEFYLLNLIFRSSRILTMTDWWIKFLNL